MSAGYVLADVEILDQDAYDDYRRDVLATVEQYRGRFLVRGGAWEPLEGDWRPGRLVVLEFPSVEDARRWYDSPEYRPLRELRAAASDSRLLLVEGWSRSPL